jgi:hypothetical protein
MCLLSEKARTALLCWSLLPRTSGPSTCFVNPQKHFSDVQGCVPSMYLCLSTVDLGSLTVIFPTRLPNRDDCGCRKIPAELTAGNSRVQKQPPNYPWLKLAHGLKALSNSNPTAIVTYKSQAPTPLCCVWPYLGQFWEKR